MGDDPKPGDKSQPMTPEEAEQINAAIDARRRQGAGERRRPRNFRPPASKFRIQLREASLDKILALGVSELQRQPADNSGLRPLSRSTALRWYVRRRLAEVGVSVDAIPAREEREIRRRLEDAALESAQRLEDFIRDEFDQFVAKAAIKYNGTPEEAERLAKELVAHADDLKVNYYRMSDELVDYVENRLRGSGMGDLDALRIAEKIIAHFENPARYPDSPADRGQVDLIVDLVLSVTAADFNRAAKLTLPPRAPGVWSRREDREEGENVVQFLRRVWGRYMDAGILYQDDIKRLGDPKLMASVRTYCHQHGLDPASVLPPPQRVRLERALAQVEPGSPAAMLLQERMRHRQETARRRREHQSAPA
jgi:hypothetical protein